MLREHVDARPGRQQLALLARAPRARVRVGEDPAEVRVAALRLAEQRHVRAADSVTSAPVIGRTPKCFAACANSSEP